MIAVSGSDWNLSGRPANVKEFHTTKEICARKKVLMQYGDMSLSIRSFVDSTHGRRESPSNRAGHNEVRISALKLANFSPTCTVRCAMKYFGLRTNQSNRALARVLLPSGADRRP
jgi:hypothetical protein